MQYSEAFWEKNDLFRQMHQISFPPSIIKQIAEKRLYVRKNNPYHAGRHKCTYEDHFSLTNDEKYSKRFCAKCNKERQLYYIYQPCQCHLCQDWGGCRDNKSINKIYFVCKQCEWFKPLSSDQQKQIKFPEKVAKEKQQRQRRNLQYELSRQKRLQSIEIIKKNQEERKNHKYQRSYKYLGRLQCSFGKYKGLTWNQIRERDETYITEFILGPGFVGEIKKKVAAWAARW